MKEIEAETHAEGGMAAYRWDRDPKRLIFMLARYKFAGRMLEGKSRVLEVGCSDGFGSRIVRQHVDALVAVDLDAASIEEAKRGASPRWPIEFRVADILADPVIGAFDAVYCLDVFEHMVEEDRLLSNLRASAPVCIIGTPSIESQVYASEASRAGHVNCVSKSGLRERMQRHFRHVFMFGMNDEVLHCGHDGMTHYLFGLGVA